MKTAGASAAALTLQNISGFAQISTGGRKKPNVLFFPVDDLRPQLGCFGHAQMISPTIDRLASEGSLFRRAYCQVPVCGASRASLLTGIRPTRGRFIDFYTKVDEDIPGALTLPKHLRNNGYHTISNGKVFHHADDTLESWSEQPWRPKGEWVGRGYITDDNKKIALDTDYNGRGPAYEIADVPDNAYPDGAIADKAIADLRRLKDMGKPFFLAAGFMKPHLPFNAPRKYWDLYRRENIDLADNPFRPKGAPDAALHNWGELRNYIGIPQEGPLSDDLARTLIHGYYACVSYTDAQIGRVLAELDRLGLSDNTIVVLWGDHGWQLGEHGLWCKHCNFETSLHSPLLVRAPGFKGGNVTDALTEYVDIFPSLSELCGFAVPEHLQGSSFVPLMQNPDTPWKKAAFSRYHDGDSIRTDRYRYTEWRRELTRVTYMPDVQSYARMLYDHETDPMENVNIAEFPENKALVERLSMMLYDGWEAVRM
ncbi:MAG: sulfatase [Candidatus Latescibacteria bacterium]|nr:sulfatase [Candidatus Latescibacterota bacterium]